MNKRGTTRIVLTLPIPRDKVHTIQTNTSHNTFVTVRAESGVVGLALLVLPWVVIAWRAVAAARRGLVESWVVAGCVGVAATYVIGAQTYDARFFPLIAALPFITLGLVRKELSQRRMLEPSSP
jgi:O-antigen ligase